MTLLERIPGRQLHEPVLIVFLDGWIDAGFGGAAAMAAINGQIDSEPIAIVADEELLDRRARRPLLKLSDGVHNGLAWPSIQLRAGTDGAGNDVLLLLGPEPDMHWQRFAREVTTVSAEVGVRVVIGLGAFPAPVPHTRPVRLAATASSAELAAQVGFVSGTVEVPAGIQAVLEQAHAEVGIPAVGLWARVPHYVAAMPYPPAGAALVDGVVSVAGVELASGDLHAAADATRQRVDGLIANSPEHIEMVRQLEHQIDANEPGLADGELPSGDELAAELERFLRDQQ